MRGARPAFFGSLLRTGTKEVWAEVEGRKGRIRKEGNSKGKGKRVRAGAGRGGYRVSRSPLMKVTP